MSKETLEEAAENYLHRVADGKRSTGYADEDFIEGAKWQAERMYSYDELRHIAYLAYVKGQLNFPTENKFNLWIQEHKKK